MTHASAPASRMVAGPSTSFFRKSPALCRPSAGLVPPAGSPAPSAPSAEPHGSPRGGRSVVSERVACTENPRASPLTTYLRPSASRQPPHHDASHAPAPAPYAPDVLTDSVGPGQATVSRGVPQTDHAHRNGVCGFHGADPGRGAAHGRARLAARTPAQGSVLPVQVRRGPTLSCLGSALGPVGETAPADSRVTRGMVTRTVTAHTRPQAPGTTRKAIDLEACRPTGRQTREG